jgi:hypothetical protein
MGRVDIFSAARAAKTRKGPPLYSATVCHQVLITLCETGVTKDRFDRERPLAYVAPALSFSRLQSATLLNL